MFVAFPLSRAMHDQTLTLAAFGLTDQQSFTEIGYYQSQLRKRLFKLLTDSLARNLDTSSLNFVKD